MIKSLMLLLALLPQSQTPVCDEETSKALVQRAEIVVQAKVIEVEPPLGLWSGYHAIGQHVKYEIEEVIKGKLAGREIYVAHGIWKNTATVDTEQARLSPKLFAKGNRFVLFLVTEHDNGYLTRTHPAQAYLSLNDKCLPKPDVETLMLIRQYAVTK
jgi:hypothetical protein